MEKSVHGDGDPDVMKYEELNNQIKRIAYRSFSDRMHLEASCKYHKEIAEAIRAGQKVRDEVLTRMHVLKGLKVQEKLSKRNKRME